MIIVNPTLCTKCGRCADICHEHAIHMEAAFPIIDVGLCSTCTQCIAICPAQALSWDGVPAIPFSPDEIPAYAQLMELFQERRSIRRFKPAPVERGLLAEIIQTGALAAFHPGQMRALVVDDPAIIHAIDAAEMATIRRVYTLLFRPKLFSLLAGWFGFKGEMERARPKLENSLKRQCSFASLPAALILMVSDKRTALQSETAQLMLANIQYAAQLKGVGTCFWGNSTLFLDKHAGLRKALGIRKDEKVYGGMYLGYPAVKFRNKVFGKTLPIQWNAQRIQD